MFDYAETEYLRRSQRYEKSGAETSVSDYAETEYLKTKSKTSNIFGFRSNFPHNAGDKSIGRNGNGDTGLHDSEYFTTFVFR